MGWLKNTAWIVRRTAFVFGLTVGLLAGDHLLGQNAGKLLRIGTSGKLSLEEDKKDDASLGTLKSFIKEETSFDNEIVRQKDWRALTEKMAKGELDLGFFQGYEFAWARQKDNLLKPLALAINVQTYPTAHVVTQKAAPATQFTGLKGKSLAISKSAQRSSRLFLEQQCAKEAQKHEDFFSKVEMLDNSEKALDQVVDGAVFAALVDRTALEEYKRRKPVRFQNLKELVRSSPIPPPLVAYREAALDDATLTRLRSGLLTANQKEKGETLLGMFRLTGFIAPPGDFERVLEESLITYPMPAANSH